MKQYLIDELRPQDYKKIKSHLHDRFGPAAVDGIYWIPLAEEILTDVQRSHSECLPFYFAIDLEETLLSCELLVRTRQRIRCDCIAYATESQRNWLINYVDGLLEACDVMT